MIFILGHFLEKIKVPWIFAALFLGILISIYAPFKEIASSETFLFLSNLGMYFLLFMIGFEIDIKEFKKKSSFIIKSTLVIILLEAFFGSILIHYLFNYNWVISILVALSFATVGEAILIPILDEFKIIRTKFGQTLIEIGTLDDLFEILTLILLVILLGSKINYNGNFIVILFSLILLFFMTYSLTKLKKETKAFKFLNIETLFFFTIFVLFSFLGIGSLADSAPLAALLSGMALGNFIPENRLRAIENEIRAMSYGFFAPIFFLWVGSTVDLNYLFTYPLLVILVVLVSSLSKILASFLSTRKELGIKQSILLGIGLSVRFSTSIIIVKILFENKLIGNDLYSVLIASSIIFTSIIPVLFSNLLAKWMKGKKI